MRLPVIWIAGLAACGPTVSSNVDGGRDGTQGNESPIVDAPACGVLMATFRDFKADHPDFEEAEIGDDRGFVQVDLGADNLPVYAPAGSTLTVDSPASFAQWYRDVAGVNMKFTQPLPLVENPPGTFTFDDSSFFPLDGMGFPNEEVLGHNFHFTTEIHGTFVYHGGEMFTFTGDDDVWVFVNKKRALDLGGVHGAEMSTIDFDARAAELGIAINGTYQLDVFHAERHTSESNFRMVTTIDCLVIQ